jgi:hypothetical protein
MMKVDGSCHCGQVTFTADIDPGAVRICHCTDCQTFSGSAFRVSVHTPAANFSLRTGQPKIYIKIAENGNQRAQAFCPECGTGLYATEPRDPKFYGIRIGTLKQRAELEPTRQIWHRSALSWVEDIGQIQHTEKQ